MRRHLTTLFAAFVLGLVLSPIKSPVVERLVAVLAKEWPIVATLAAASAWHANEVRKLWKKRAALDELLHAHLETIDDFIARHPDSVVADALRRSTAKARLFGIGRRRLSLSEAEDASRFDGGFES